MIKEFGKSNRKYGYVLVALLFVVAAGLTSHAATVTVDPTALAVPGSIYTSLNDAVDNLGGGDNWGDGVNDTILIEDATPVIVTSRVTCIPFDATSPLTIKNATGASPIIAMGNPMPDRMFRVTNSGNYIFEGLTVIGAAGLDADAQGNRTAFWVDAGDPGFVVNVTFSDCVITANDGTNNPRLDWSGSFPASNLGAMNQAIQHGDDPYRGKVSITIENCAIGFTTNDDGCIYFGRSIDGANPFSDPTRSLTIRNTLIANNLSHATRIRGVSAETTVLIEDCLFELNAGRASIINPESGGGDPDITIRDTLIDNTGGSTPINIDGEFGGSLTVERATISRPGADLIIVEGQSGTKGDFTLTDIIDVDGDSVFRHLNPGSATPASVVVAGIASDSPYRGSQSQVVQDAFDAAGWITESPDFVSTAFDSSFDGLSSWDSATNDLFDVQNDNFATAGSGGGALSGGAEFAPLAVDSWMEY